MKLHAGLLLAVLSVALFAGCLTPSNDDQAAKHIGFPATPSYANPVNGSVTKLEFVAQLVDSEGQPVPSAGGNFVFGDYVFGGGLNGGFFIADIHDPEHPVLLYNSTRGDDAETPFARKADVVDHPDGRRTLVLATQSNGMHFWDVTNPAHPIFASRVEFEANHNIAVIPGTEYVFNNPSKGRGGSNALLDVHDPYNPRIVGDFGTHGCHGTTFSGKFGHGLLRGYCAAIERTEIWDLTGLDVTMKDFNITVIGVVEGVADSPVTGSPVANPQIPANPLGITSTPLRNLHHFATASNDGNILIIGDEHRGGGNPGACFYYNEATGTSTPIGALWFYDITIPSDPLLLSWISPPTVMPQAPAVPSNPNADPSVAGQAVNSAYTAVPNCTAHFGTVIPGEDKIVIAWYSAGVLLIDFSNPNEPVILDQYQVDGINTWNARQWNGYVFTGDMNRGMDVLRLA